MSKPLRSPPWRRTRSSAPSLIRWRFADSFDRRQSLLHSFVDYDVRALADGEGGSALTQLVEPLGEERLVNFGQRSHLFQGFAIGGAPTRQQNWIDLHIAASVCRDAEGQRRGGDDTKGSQKPIRQCTSVVFAKVAANLRPQSKLILQ